MSKDSVFVLEELLEDKFVINMLLHIFQCIFPDCDRSCKNMDRMFFGGKEASEELKVWYAYAILIPISSHLHLMSAKLQPWSKSRQLLRPLLESFDIGKHYSENMKRFARKMDILLVISSHLHLMSAKLQPWSKSRANICIATQSFADMPPSRCAGTIMFFGGKEVIYFDGEARLALVQLLRPLLESFDIGKHYSETNFASCPISFPSLKSS